MTDKDLIRKIAIDVQDELQMGGLADGLYGDFAEAVAIRYHIKKQSNLCDHTIIDARNSVIQSGYMCIKCGALFKAHSHE